MKRTVVLLKWLVILVAVAAMTALAIRAWQSQRGPPLRPWHTHAPHELTAGAIARADWNAYLVAEQAVFDEVRTEVTQKLAPEDRVDANRYFDGSPIHPGKFVRDWNRSFIMEPDGVPLGAVVLLHGLTDSPYSSRHIAQRYLSLIHISEPTRPY